MERTPNLLGAWIYIMSHWIYFTSLIGSHKTELSISTDLEHFGYRHRYRNSGSLHYGVMQPELQLSLIQFLRFLLWREFKSIDSNWNQLNLLTLNDETKSIDGEHYVCKECKKTIKKGKTLPCNEFTHKLRIQNLDAQYLTPIWLSANLNYIC